MPFYVRRGQIPHKRHTQFRRPDGELYKEEVFGTKGFSGVESILYHVHPPTAVRGVGDFREAPLHPEDEGPLRHRHFRTGQLTASGHPIESRQYLLGNDDVKMGVCVAARSMEYAYKNAEADELLFIHEGEGTLRSVFGNLPFHEGDYVVIPAGTIYQFEVTRTTRYLLIESQSPIDIPKRYRNEYGQMLEHAPFCERDIRVPDYADPVSDPVSDTSDFPLLIKARNGFTRLTLAHHPFDVVGWDGYVYPYAFNIEDFEPITGRIHQPPPVHQTFAGEGFVICSFVPRLFDYHPEAIPAPYNHSNIDSDEVLYYVRGNFMSRKGIEVGSITLHPSGIPHGPHPGTAEASIGKPGTEELAVMMDTFRPLKVLQPATTVEDTNYMFSWLDEK
ncbi:homogentisate 1,2-dioxygenase [Alicyclobacillus mengziensis]|uniref:Homogentisate 1,2-dioxygenase n=1 Tax=Alicyclobacillus mengziensis TaxID=2931921 RepID=A0A9X7W2G0_9BACL|nr:homogentisate 1,2-dioxygenase [Alicyclobacillus mengziensis]QSO49109.1 homogentisate 1,2-dioxygenase [Alicyclobacillus mengziensis]